MRIAIVTLLFTGCTEYGLNADVDAGDADTEIEVYPTQLRLGPVRADEEIRETFEIRNLGDTTLDVSEIRIDTGAAAFTLVDAEPIRLASGERQTVEVAFTPVGDLVYGQIMVLSNDVDEAEVPVFLEGLGQVPALEISPGSHVFSTACDDDVVLTLQNVGIEDLEITDVTYDTAGNELTLDSDLSLPLTLPPGEWRQVTVRSQVDGNVAVSLGEIRVASNDPRGLGIAEQQIEVADGSVTEEFSVTENPPTDILFAVDHSCSMTEDAQNLGRAFSEFIGVVDTVTQDWQIGVVTQTGACANGGIITVDTPDYEDKFLAAASLEPANDSLTEELFTMVDRALDKTGAGECNAGFLRPNTLAHVIVVSDEEEQSDDPWNTFVSRWQGLVTDPSYLVVSAVVDADPTDDDENDSCGEYGEGYVPAAQNTGGVVLDICSTSWAVHAAALGAVTAETLKTFDLSAVPDETSIVVLVNGVATSDWSYDSVRNTITVDGELLDGDTLSVTYTAIGC